MITYKWEGAWFGGIHVMAVPSPGQVLPPPHKPTRITELPFSSKILRSSFWPEILDSILAVKHGFSLRRRKKPPPNFQQSGIVG